MPRTNPNDLVAVYLRVPRDRAEYVKRRIVDALGVEFTIHGIHVDVRIANAALAVKSVEPDLDGGDPDPASGSSTPQQITSAITEAERIGRMVEQAQTLYTIDRRAAAELLEEITEAVGNLPDLHELHAVGAFPSPAEFADAVRDAEDPDDLERIVADLDRAVRGD